MGKGSKGWWVVLALVVVGGGWVGAHRWRPRGPRLDLEALTVTVTPQTVTSRVEASGVLVPLQSVNVSPKVAGTLVELLVEQGDEVQAGQLLARMDASGLLPQRERLNATVAAATVALTRLRNGNRPEDIAAARARVASARTRRDLLQRRLERQQTLFAQGAIAQDALDESEANLKAAIATLEEQTNLLRLLEQGPRVEDIAQAEAQLREAQAQRAALDVQIADTEIRAPFAGVVTQKFASVGAFVTPTTTASVTNSATSTSIVAIATGLEVLAKVPEADIAQIRVGQPVEITVEAYPDRRLRGRVRLIAPQAIEEQNVTSFQVRVAFEDTQDLKSGTNADLRFLGEKVENRLLVPTVAISTRQGQTGVNVPDAQGRPQFRPVRLGNTYESNTEVLDGLESGDRVFVQLPERTRP
ncbi:MAG: efflux RND transporter periplasmic adaptor subunit [Pseudanabaenaceae cyanobacterium]